MTFGQVKTIYFFNEKLESKHAGQYILDLIHT